MGNQTCNQREVGAIYRLFDTYGRFKFTPLLIKKHWFAKKVQTVKIAKYVVNKQRISDRDIKL